MNDRQFINIAGGGRMTELTYDVPSRLKTVLGQLAYYLKGIEMLPSIKSSYVRIFWYIKKLKPDLIHSSLWSANIIARLWGAIFSIHVDCALHTVTQHSGKFRNYIDWLFPFNPTAYIAIS